MSETPTLTTARFTLRPVARGDERALLAGFSDEASMRYWGRGPFASEEELAAWLFDPDWNGRTWVAVPHDGGDPVMRLVASAPQEQVAEIGYIVMPSSARQGIARECLTALIDHLVTVEGNHRICADVDPRNEASGRLLRSLGFTCEARLRHTMKTHIGWCDSHIWGLLDNEWQPGGGEAR